MKVIVVLLVALAIQQAPAFGALSDADFKRVEQMMNTALAPVIKELNELTAEVAAVKTEVQVLKTEVAAVKTELAAVKNEVSELKGAVSVQGDRISDQGNWIASLESRLSSQTNTLLLVAGFLVTFLLWMLKQQWDARREDNKKITSQKKTIVALQAEIERLKLGIVTGQGKPAPDTTPS